MGRANQTLRFTHLRLENWRNFTTVDVELQRRVFIVGPNASGKSNLLDAFRFLRDIASVGGGFQDAVQKRGGISRLRCLAARRQPDLTLSVRLGNEQDRSVWEYTLQFGQHGRRPIVKGEIVIKGGQIVISRPDSDDQEDTERLTQTHMEQVLANREFREVAEFLSQVSYFHIVPQLVREPNRWDRDRHDPFGGDFLEQVALTRADTRESRLGKIVKALQVAVPQLEALEHWRDDRGTPHLRGKYAHWRPQGAWQTEESFSDGTLRLIGLLWSALDGDGPLLLEEPELSLHSDVVRLIPQMFARIQRQSGRQVVISTHSSDMLRDDGIGLDEVLLLRPSAEGTVVFPATNIREASALLEGGESMADVVIPRTRPENVEQLALFEA